MARALAKPEELILISGSGACDEDLRQRLNGIGSLTDIAPDDLEHTETGRNGIYVFDLRGAGDGGHSACRWLDALECRDPDVRAFVVTDADCPEPIQRRLACSDRFVGGYDPIAVCNKLEEHLDTLAPDHPRTTRRVGKSASGTSRFDASAEILTKFATNSPSVRIMLDELAVAASHDVTILLIGETGAGKTYLSKLVHDASPRRNEPFLHVACGALPGELIESELFGHVRGAFTGAHADKDGKFVAAGCGTILLDEIDVLGPEQQVKLLRVLETGDFEPVGSNRTLTSQARLVVASNLELEPLVEQGKFRADLYYRLNMLKFDIPPLRRRKVDIVPLVNRFIEKFSERHDVVVEHVQSSYLDALIAYDWPGNVRELEHVVQRSVIYCRNGELTCEHLPSHVTRPRNIDATSLQTAASVAESYDGSLENLVSLTEREIIEDALRRNNFSRTNTAKDLGISRVTLYNKMKRHQLMG